MFAAVPAPVRPPASGLVPLKNAAWLSRVVSEPTHILRQKISPAVERVRSRIQFYSHKRVALRCYRINSCYLSNFDQTAAGLLAIIVRNGEVTGSLRRTGPDRYAHKRQSLSL